MTGYLTCVLCQNAVFDVAVKLKVLSVHQSTTVCITERSKSPMEERREFMSFIFNEIQREVIAISPTI